MTKVLPPEVVKFFTWRFSPDKQLFFDQVAGTIKLIDDYALLLAKPNRTDEEKQLIELCTSGGQSMVSTIPFSHLVASYQAALKDPQKTIEIIERTEHKETVESQKDTILAELKFIDNWLAKWAPEDVKFELRQEIDPSEFNDSEKEFLSSLADKIEHAPASADGEWFHKAIYEFKESHGAEPKQLFTTLYKALIGKQSGPRAGWFLSILPRDWLIKRLRLEK
jgi:lysyl-tRNA synthetase class 1